MVMPPSLSHLSDYKYKQGVNVVIAVCFTSSTSTTYTPYLNLFLQYVK